MAAPGCEEHAKEFKICPAKPERPPITIQKCGPPPLSACPQKSGGKGNVLSHGNFLSFLQSIREPIATYQEKRGLPKYEQYGFINLVTSLSQHAYSAILTIITMLYNLLPLLEGFSYLARFVLDKLIEICQTNDGKEKMIKIAMFFGELIIIILIMVIICVFILLPVWYLFSYMFSKIWNLFLSSG